MKTRRSPTIAPFALARSLTVYHLIGAALPLVLGGCSGDDSSPVAAAPSASPAAPGSGAPAETPAAEVPTEAPEATPENGIPAASPSEGQPAVDLAPPAEGTGVPAGGEGEAAVPPAPEDVSPSSCVGQAFTTADPTSPGPFAVTADKFVGPLAGALPDPVYGDQQQRFNVYRPSNLADSGFCHPILVWANGFRDNPEQNPPACFVDPATNTWCGTYPGLMNQLASHGFVVIASLSTTTASGQPLPTITGLDWLLEQAEDPASPYFHRLDTARIGALGHSMGGAATSIAAADPRLSAIATVSGVRALDGLHTPALLICGQQDTVVPCDGIADTFRTVTDQPAIFLNNLAADHGSWLGQGGSQGPTFFALTAWFRMHLMDDVDNSRFFFGQDCALCTDDRVTIERNGLIPQ